MSEKKPLMSDIVVNKPVTKKVPVSVAKKIPQPTSDLLPTAELSPTLSQQHYDRSPRSTAPLLWGIAVICSGALILGIGGLLSSAEILITPRQFTGTIDQSIVLTQDRVTTTGVFFGTATKVVTREQSVPNIGRASESRYASGTVVFYNATPTSKTIPAKTEIINSVGKKYTTTRTLVIPPQQATTPGSSEGEVVAQELGMQGNSSLDDFTFTSSLKKFTGITIRSRTEITGGATEADIIVDPLVKEATIQSLQEQLADTQQLMARLAEQIPEDMMIIPMVIPDGAITTKQVVDDEGMVRLVAERRITVLIVNRAEIARALARTLQVPQTMQLTLTDTSQLTITTPLPISGQTIPQTLPLRITGNLTVSGFVSGDVIKNASKGSSRKEVKSFMENIPEIDTYYLRMKPFWRKLVPLQDAQVRVVIN